MGHAKVHDAESCRPTLVDRWLNHAVDRGFIVPTGKEVDGITGVDDLHEVCEIEKPASMYATYHCVVDMFNPLPFTVRGHNLEAADGLTPEYGYAADILRAIRCW